MKSKQAHPRFTVLLKKKSLLAAQPAVSYRDFPFSKLFRCAPCLTPRFNNHVPRFFGLETMPTMFLRLHQGGQRPGAFRSRFGWRVSLPTCPHPTQFELIWRCFLVFRGKGVRLFGRAMLPVCFPSHLKRKSQILCPVLSLLKPITKSVRTVQDKPSLH